MAASREHRSLGKNDPIINRVSSGTCISSTPVRGSYKNVSSPGSSSGINRKYTQWQMNSETLSMSSSLPYHAKITSQPT